jgi:hypothetical protein
MATIDPPSLSVEMRAEDWSRVKTDGLKLSVNNVGKCVIRGGKTLGVGLSPRQALYDLDRKERS